MELFEELVEEFGVGEVAVSKPEISEALEVRILFHTHGVEVALLETSELADYDF